MIWLLNIIYLFVGFVQNKNLESTQMMRTLWPVLLAVLVLFILAYNRYEQNVGVEE